MELTCEALGITKEELTKRVVDQICGQLLTTQTVDEEEGFVQSDETPFAGTIQSLVIHRIKREVARMAEAHILPNVSNMIENLILQRTNEWGEKYGQPVSFIEYLVQSANNYMTEMVDCEGETQEKSRSSFWKPSQTRVAYMIDKHLQYSISVAMGTVIKDANKTLVDGITETVKAQLAKIAEKIKVGISVE